MPAKEAKARIKINRLLEESGWRFFSDKGGEANVVLEPNVKLTKKQVDELGENFETISSGFIDFLLLDEKGFPLVVLEAKAEDKSPLIVKEQARKYAKSQTRASRTRSRHSRKSFRLSYLVVSRARKSGASVNRQAPSTS